MINLNFLFYVFTGTALAAGSAAGYHFIFGEDNSGKITIAADNLAETNDKLEVSRAFKEEKTNFLNIKTTELSKLNKEGNVLSVKKTLLNKAKEIYESDSKSKEDSVKELTEAKDKAKNLHSKQVEKQTKEEEKIAEEKAKLTTAKATYEEEDKKLKQLQESLTTPKQQETVATNDVAAKTKAKDDAIKAVEDNKKALSNHLFKGIAVIPYSVMDEIVTGIYGIFDSTKPETSPTERGQKIKNLITEWFGLPNLYKTDTAKAPELTSKVASTTSELSSAQSNLQQAKQAVSGIQENINKQTTTTNASKTSCEELEKSITTLETTLVATKLETKRLSDALGVAEKALSDKQADSDSEPSIPKALSKITETNEEGKGVLAALIASTQNTEGAKPRTIESLISSNEQEIKINNKLVELITGEITELNEKISLVNGQIALMEAEASNLVKTQ